MNDLPRKVFDVRRPGRAPASSTSRPLIVGHKPQINDPSVTVNGVGLRRPLLDPRQKIAVSSPGNDPQQPVQAAGKLAAAGVAASVADQKAPQATPYGFEPAEITPMPAPSSLPQKPANMEVAPVSGEDALLAGLPAPAIKEEQVMVSPHIPRQGSAWKIVVAILVLVLLVVAAFDVLLDAGFLEWNIPHTHFL